MRKKWPNILKCYQSLEMFVHTMNVYFHIIPEIQFLIHQYIRNWKYHNAEQHILTEKTIYFQLLFLSDIICLLASIIVLRKNWPISFPVFANKQIILRKANYLSEWVFRKTGRIFQGIIHKGRAHNLFVVARVKKGLYLIADIQRYDTALIHIPAGHGFYNSIYCEAETSCLPSTQQTHSI